MNRIVLYRINSAGWVVPIKKSYRKARYRRHMSRYHDAHEFHKKKGGGAGMNNRNGLYLCIKEIPEELSESVRPCYGYLFKFRGQLPKNGCISLGSVYPNEKISVHIDPEFFDEYFRDINKMIIIDHEPTECFRCPLSYRYHDIEYIDEPEWHFFCNVDGNETVYLDDDGETYKDRTDCPAHRVNSGESHTEK